ncbi:OTAnrps [Symbiodinium natans]|uniref:OTAnrps protein n=1 Tax=Symbiodinium natans TaxID=878477 RepID=A0A812N9R3_9DINO|nr:OTAnrps [Symbiodinium natans]
MPQLAEGSASQAVFHAAAAALVQARQGLAAALRSWRRSTAELAAVRERLACKYSQVDAASLRTAAEYGTGLDRDAPMKLLHAARVLGAAEADAAEAAKVLVLLGDSTDGEQLMLSQWLALCQLSKGSRASELIMYGNVSCVGWGRRRFQLTYGEVSAKSKALASALSKIRCREEGAATASVDWTVVAIHHSREDPDFLPTLLAASRCGQRFVLLSRDLTDEKLQRSRNDFVLHSLRPWLVIGGDGNSEAHRSVPRLEEPRGSLLNGDDHHVPPVPSDGICFIFTGGTVRTKIVEVTHRMFLHEKSSYWELWTPRRRPVVLAHTSVYWAASALGQLSIALAYGGTAVLTEMTEVAKLQQCIAEEQITVLGVVPEHLDLLARKPAEDLPNIDLVFTWGERLPPQLAQRWRGHGAALRELLVSSEYWLTCWADPLEDGLLRGVRAAKILVLTDQGTEAAHGELGILCIGGPMVMAGYHQNARVAAPADVFIVHENQRFFRTSDLVRRERGGIVFKGRADMMAKSGGKWVDMTAVEDTIIGTPGVQAGKILPDSASEQFHAFVALSGEQMRPDRVLDAVRQKLPPRVQLWLLTDLPRHPVTRKIDLAQLSRIIEAPPASWPLESGEPTTMYKERLQQTLQSQVLWTMVAMGTSCVCGCSTGDLPRQLGLTAAWLAALRCLAGLPGTAPVPRLAATVLWLATLPRWEKAMLLRWLCSASALTFSFLALTHADDARQRGLSVGLWIFRVVDELPMWKFGFFVWTALLRHAPAPLGWAAAAALGAAAASGAFFAGHRGRLGAFPLLFWGLGIGHQLEIDIRGWVHLTTWRDHAWRLLGLCQEQLLRFWPTPATPVADAEPATEEKPAESETPRCTGCGEEAGGWSLTLPRRKILCERCTQTFAETAEAKVAAFVEGASPGLAEPLAKRPRLDPGAGGEVSYLQRLHAAKGQPAASIDLEEIEKWWWYHHVCDEIHELPTPAGWEEDVEQSPDPNPNLSAEAQRLFKALGEVEPLLRPVTPSSVLLGLDSLRIARLANKLRNEFGCMVPAPRIREVRTAKELAEIVAVAPRVAACDTVVGAMPEDVGKEYAIWFSPGQVSPMGQWVLRGHGRLNHEALTEATRRLAERHPALRLKIVDPLRYLSFTFDVGVLYTLVGPLLERGSWLGCIFRQALAWALEKSWPRVRCFSRREIYASRNEAALPLDIIQINHGQEEFESTLKRRRYNLVPPAQITGYEMVCHLEGQSLDDGSHEGRAQGLSGRRPQLILVALASALWNALGPPTLANFQKSKEKNMGDPGHMRFKGGTTARLQPEQLKHLSS